MSCSSVVLQAPSFVMAKAVEILIGDRKMFSSLDFPSASCLKNERAKRLLALDSSHTRGLVPAGIFSGFQLVPFQDPGCGRRTLAPKVDLWASRCRYLWLPGPNRGRVPTKPTYMPTTSSCLRWNGKPAQEKQFSANSGGQTSHGIMQYNVYSELGRFFFICSLIRLKEQTFSIALLFYNEIWWKTAFTLKSTVVTMK